MDTGFPLVNSHFAISNDAVNGRGYGAGARPGLQIRCFPALVGKGEFDSHALPPFIFKMLECFREGLQAT